MSLEKQGQTDVSQSASNDKVANGGAATSGSELIRRPPSGVDACEHEDTPSRGERAVGGFAWFATVASWVAAIVVGRMLWGGIATDANAVVGICTVALFALSLTTYVAGTRYTKKSLRVAENGLKLARQQRDDALATARQENRAWVVVQDVDFLDGWGSESDGGPFHTIGLAFQNTGKTPAVNVYYDSHQEVTPLRGTPIGKTPSPEPPLCLGPGQVWKLRQRPPETILDMQSEEPNTERHFMFTVRYQDISGSDHVTSFCLRRWGTGYPKVCRHAGASYMD